MSLLVKKTKRTCCARRDYDGRTALHIAAARGSLKVIDYLLSCRADANAVDMCAQLATRSPPCISSAQVRDGAHGLARVLISP